MKTIIQYFRREAWSPYIAGIVLGIVGILAVLTSNHVLEESGAFENIAGMVGKVVAPTLFDNIYFNFVMPPGINWALILLVGVFFGGMLGAWSSSTLRLRDNEDRQWIKVFGPARWKRWLLLFIGAIIVEYGAGIAGGCTSGLAISGGMLLAPAAFIFMAGMFMSGIATALIIYRRRY
jgi:hypothetical protein